MPVVGDLASRVGTVPVTRLAIGFGAMVVLGLCVLAALGSRPAVEILVTVVALVVLVGGGNWINGRGQPGRGQPGRGQPGRGQPGRGQPGHTVPTPPSSTFDPADEIGPERSEVRSRTAPGLENGGSEGR